MRGALSFAAFVLAAALAGCGLTLRDATRPVFLSGEDAGAIIDREAGAMLAARHPGLGVGPARCPYLMNLTNERVGTCTIPLGGTSPMRIGIANDAITHQFFFPRDIDAVVVSHDAEPQLADDLARTYGTAFRVRCPGPPVQVLPVHAHFTCSIDAEGIDAHRIEVFADDRDGRLRAAPLEHTATLLSRKLGHAAERTSGRFVVAGPSVEQFLNETAGGSLHGELARRGLLGSAHCPTRIVLSETTRPACTVRGGEKTVSYILFFRRGRGLVISPSEHFVVVPALQDLARRYFERRVQPMAVTNVNCGHERVATVDEETELHCTATYGGRKHTFSAEFLGADGYDVNFSEKD